MFLAILFMGISIIVGIIMLSAFFALFSGYVGGFIIGFLKLKGLPIYRKYYTITMILLPLLFMYIREKDNPVFSKGIILILTNIDILTSLFYINIFVFSVYFCLKFIVKKKEPKKENINI